jgi:amino acid adenylation domain-containing protein
MTSNLPLNDFENISRHFPTIVELLRYRSDMQSDATAFTFLQDGETQTVTLTYQELDRHSRAIASQLQALGLTGERAVLLYPPGLDYLAAFFGCLYAGVIAVPAYPPRNQRNTPRILSILRDAQAAIVLTTTTALSQIQILLGNQDVFQWLTTDNLEPGIESAWQEPLIERDTLAFLQYTSGSTGTPKGVMLNHGNLLHNAFATYQVMGHSPSSKFVTWLPIYHDMGLIGGVLQPLYGGFPCVMMPPATFLQRPYRWLKVISQHQGTTSGAPNFAYELCVLKITPEQRSTLDLSSWTVAFNGAEPIRQQTLDNFAQTFAECGFRPEAFYPCYGMAEATLMVSGSVKAALHTTKTVKKTALATNKIIESCLEKEKTQILVSCGRNLPQQQIAIANLETLTCCAANEVGEIWVSGLSIGQGYWNRWEETEQTFHAYLKDTGEGPFLRTGDLGFIDNGELFITGRVKDVIIIRGRNLYPQDIELTAERSHSSLRLGSSAAFSIEEDAEERLIVVQEVEFRAKPDVEEVVTAIRQAVTAEHEVQVYAVVLIKAGTIPKTSSGKIQRQATKVKYLANNLEVIGQSILEDSTSVAEVESLKRQELLAFESQEQLRLLESYLKSLVRVKTGNLASLQQPLSSVGLDSLKIFELKNRIEEDLKVVVSIVDFFEGITISQLAQQILEQVLNSVKSELLPISRVKSKSDCYPLSFSQQRLWFMDQLQSGNAAYNIPVAVVMKGRLDVSALVRSIEEIIQRHEILRTSFQVVEGEAVQKITSAVNVRLPEIDLRNRSEAERRAEVEQLSLQAAQSPFDLGQLPLWRFKLLFLKEDESILLLTLHHIIADGWSIKLFIKELSLLYAAFSQGKSSPLEELPVQYVDFISWQKQYFQTEAFVTSLTYWRQQLCGELPVLELPIDYQRSPVQTYRGAQQKFVLSQDLTDALKKLSQQQDVTLFMTLLAAYQILLCRYTGLDDIIVGSPIANRNHAEIESLIGCFINTLVFRTNLDGNPCFEELLCRVRKVAIDAYTHQDLPFEKLVEELQSNRDLIRHPLFQVMFVLQNSEFSDIELPNLSWKTVELDTGTAKFDIFLSMMEGKDGLMGTLEYNTDLFSKDTITRMVRHFQTLLEGIIANPSEYISNLPLLTPAERQTLLMEWNDTQVNYPQKICIHHLFEQQVEKTPDAIALIFENEKLTYHQLNQQANKVAHHLQNLGVKPDVMVGICMERSIEMVVGILAIIKAGGAYVPLDPNYPQERLAFMLADSQVSVLLVRSHLIAELPTQSAKVVVCIDTKLTTFADFSTENPVSEVNLENLAYVIYTSGSTGKPKGAMNTHQGLCNRLLWMQETYQLTSDDRVLQKTPFSFDVSVWEFFWALFTGASLVLAKPGGHQDPNYLAELIAQEKITTLHFVPSMLQVFLEETKLDKCQSIQRVFCSGEALNFNLQERFFERLNGELYNLYGPTEAAIDVTAWRCQRDSNETIIPIGSPIANTQMYILDKYMEPVPIGVTGELYIGGAGLARGYWNRPELTEEKFISNPFLKSYELESSSILNYYSQRLYKTGDLARFRSDGNIEFLGRIDHQVKIRGFRIELGEIEAVIGQHLLVREVVVIAPEDIFRQPCLVAYVVPYQEEIISIDELRHFLTQKLPEYMIPSVFIMLSKLPLTPNGKADRRALPAPKHLRPELNTIYQAPKSDVEKKIAKIWQEVLHLEKIGVNDNFFEIGGHSLLIIQVNKKLQNIFNREISIVNLFQNPTINLLAKYFSQSSEQQLDLASMNERAKKQIEANQRMKKQKNIR